MNLHVSMRPYLRRFLTKIAKYYEVVFYTASIKEVKPYLKNKMNNIMYSMLT